MGAGYLLIRRQPRLAVYAVATSLGALVLDPVVKLLVERVRPVVDIPLAAAPGPSFPSGHALGSLVSYGVLLLIFLPTVPRRLRPAVTGLVVTVVVLVGVTRIALGVHYFTDVVGGWALGIAWLGVTAAAFARWRADGGDRTAPIADGLAPEAGTDLSAISEPAQPTHPLRTLTTLAVGAVFIVGAVVGAGVLVTAILADSGLGRVDRAAVAWLAEHRTEEWTTIMAWLNRPGDTGWIITGTLAAGGLVLAVFRRWRPLVFLWTVMAGEVTLFLITSTVVTRARPEVEPLQPDLPPTASFPSGHVSGALCLYVAIALLTWRATTITWVRYAAIAAAVLVPAGVAAARLYRGAHHPTDIVGSALLVGLWLTAAWLILTPGHPAPSPRTPPSTADARGGIPDASAVTT